MTGTKKPHHDDLMATQDQTAWCKDSKSNQKHTQTMTHQCSDKPHRLFKIVDTFLISTTAEAHYIFKAERPLENTIQTLTGITHASTFQSKPCRDEHNQWRQQTQQNCQDAILKATRKSSFDSVDPETGWQECKALITTKPWSEHGMQEAPVPKGVKNEL